MNFAILVFPASNCEVDAFHVIRDVLEQPVDYVWHEERCLRNYDCIVVPGGFSYGDHLRCGAIARFSPVMQAVREQVDNGKLVIGICNGFQILTESHLLPGALIRNAGQRFVCRFIRLRCENHETPFTNRLNAGRQLAIPVAHGEGQFVATADTLKELEANRQIVFRYCDERGEPTAESNPNGAMDNIAGIVNQAGNVLGMMPHPERCSEPELGGADGRGVWESIMNWTRQH